MTRISKGTMELGLVLAALTLGSCASAPEEQPEQQAATAAPAEETAPVVEPAPAETAPAAEPAPVAKPQASEAPVLNANVPKRYVVQRGDTLWGLATRYLRDPWRWPELWQRNPNVKNPHLLYPGDVLTLMYVEGQPTLQVQRSQEEAAPAPAPAPQAAAPAPLPTPETPAPEQAPATPPAAAAAVPAKPVEPAPKGLATVKLAPHMRKLSLEKAIPTIPYDLIGQFLSRPRILTEEEIDGAPYVFSSVDEHISTGAGNRIYVRGLKDPKTTDYVVVRKGNKYVNPDDEEDILGYEAIHVGNAVLKRTGDPATFDLTTTNREILVGDRVMPAEDGVLEQNFMPHSPPQFVDGEILAVADGVMQIGQYMVVVLNKGADAGVDVGSVLAVYSTAARVRDVVAGESVRLPRERAGTLMVFRVFERVSYGLIMQATRPIHVHDAITSP